MPISQNLNYAHLHIRDQPLKIDYTLSYRSPWFIQIMGIRDKQFWLELMNFHAYGFNGRLESPEKYSPGINIVNKRRGTQPTVTEALGKPYHG